MKEDNRDNRQDARSKGLISITELARLRNVTTETLRHYDRIGLLKPTWRDESGVRYYSLLSKDEKLGTIKELQQLGMSLQEIKDYFDERNLKKSYQLLKERERALHEKIQELQDLEKVINRKTAYLKKVMEEDFDLNKLALKYFDTRYVLQDEEAYAEIDDLEKSSFSVETKAGKEKESLGTEYFALLIPKALIADRGSRLKAHACIFLGNVSGYAPGSIRRFPSGQYLCRYVQGKEICSRQVLDSMFAYCAEKNLIPVGDVLQSYVVDLNLTDREEEMICELQVRVQSAAVTDGLQI